VSAPPEPSSASLAPHRGFQARRVLRARAALTGTLRSLAMFVVYNLIFGAVIGTTDNAAHIGGLVTGLILGALIALIAPQQDHARAASPSFSL